MIFLVMTTEAGSAMATCLVLAPLRLTKRRVASTTSSNFSMLPSLIQPASNGSIPQRSSTKLPERSCDSSTSLTLDGLTSSPNKDADWRPNNDPAFKTTPCYLQFQKSNTLKISLES